MSEVGFHVFCRELPNRDMQVIADSAVPAIAPLLIDVLELRAIGASEIACDQSIFSPPGSLIGRFG
jgi:hypothetical protein